jgi:hypothetical protein
MNAPRHREIACAILIDTCGRFLLQLRDDIVGILHPGKVGLCVSPRTWFKVKTVADTSVSDAGIYSEVQRRNGGRTAPCFLSGHNS